MKRHRWGPRFYKVVWVLSLPMRKSRNRDPEVKKIEKAAGSQPTYEESETVCKFRGAESKAVGSQPTYEGMETNSIFVL